MKETLYILMFSLSMTILSCSAEIDSEHSIIGLTEDEVREIVRDEIDEWSKPNVSVGKEFMFVEKDWVDLYQLPSVTEIPANGEYPFFKDWEERNPLGAILCYGDVVKITGLYKIDEFSSYILKIKVVKIVSRIRFSQNYELDEYDQKRIFENEPYPDKEYFLTWGELVRQFNLIEEHNLNEISN